MSADMPLLPPYARAAGIVLTKADGGSVELYLDCVLAQHGGGPGVFHGGQIGGLLEVALEMALRTAGPSDTPAARTTSMTVQYLRPAVAQRLNVAGRVVRRGRQLSYVEAEAWQDDRDKPVAVATANFTVLVDRQKQPAG